MLFKFLWRHLAGYRLLFALTILVTVSQVGCDIVGALPLKFIPSKIQHVEQDPACNFPFLDPILNIFDKDFDFKDPTGDPGQQKCPDSSQKTHHTKTGVVVFSVLMLIIFGVLGAVLTYVALFLAGYIAQNLSARLRNRLFDHLQRLSLDWHGKQRKGDLVQRITSNIADIEKLVTDGLVDIVAGVLTLVGVAVVMLLISPQYTFISLAITPALFVIVLGYTGNIKKAAKKASKAGGEVANVATEDINALTVIKVFTREEREAMRFGGRVSEQQKEGMRAAGLQAQFTPLVAFLLVLGTVVVMGVGGLVAAGHSVFAISAGSVDVGTLVLFLTYLKMVYQPMRNLSKVATLSSAAGSGAERIQEVLDQAPEVMESTKPYTGPTKLRGEITFENVVFGYTPERPILKGINLHIPEGKKVALVGLSGGGKTTLVKLIPRFYEISQGCVKISGVDNRLYPLSILRQNVSMVLQESVLFEGTVRENIEIGRPGAGIHEIIDAAKKANIHEAIMNQLGGYNRMIREQGKDLSGGQRQRMAIARAILRDAPILVLDEPTAALDVEAEAEVMHALDTLVVGRTVLMISHRLSTLGNVDEIIVLKEGQIAEKGTYKELKQQGGIFAGLLEEQNRYNIEKIGEQSIIRSAFAIPNIPRQPQAPSPATPNPNIPVQPVKSVSNGKQAQGFSLSQPPLSRLSLQTGRVQIELNGKIVGERALDKPILTVGRLASNDVRVPNRRVSRHHARIWQEKGGSWVIEDAESLYGLIYEGSHIDQHILADGDRIYLAPEASLHFTSRTILLR